MTAIDTRAAPEAPATAADIGNRIVTTGKPTPAGSPVSHPLRYVATT